LTKESRGEKRKKGIGNTYPKTPAKTSQKSDALPSFGAH